jgi:hypothetical protein
MMKSNSGVHSTTLAIVAIVLAITAPSVSGQLPDFDENAVVKIFVYSNIQLSDIHLGTYDYSFAIPSVGHGSGTIIDPAGVVLTAKHVVAGSRFISVYVPGYKFFYPAHVIYEDDSLDFAILYIQGQFKTIESLTAETPPLRKGDRVWTYGYPMIAGEPEPSINSGNITLYSQRFKKWQMDALINPGNSGGPLVDSSGQIVGIAVSGLRDAVGMNFALPIDEVIRTYDELLSRGDIRDAADRMASQDFDKREIRKILGSYLAKITINPDPTLFTDSAYLDAVRRVAQGRETVATEMSDIAAIGSAMLYNEAVAVFAANNLDPSSPLSGSYLTEETRAQVGSTFQSAMNLAQIASEIDPLISESDYVSLMQELCKIYCPRARETEYNGTSGITGESSMDNPPRPPKPPEQYLDLEETYITVEHAVFHPNSDIPIKGINVGNLDYWYSGWSVGFSSNSDHEDYWVRIMLSQFKCNHGRGQMNPASETEALKSVTMYQYHMSGFRLVNLYARKIQLALGGGFNLGWFKANFVGETDDKSSDNLNFFSGFAVIPGFRFRVGFLAAETTYELRFYGDSAGSQFNMGVGMIF